MGFGQQGLFFWHPYPVILTQNHTQMALQWCSSKEFQWITHDISSMIHANNVDRMTCEAMTMDLIIFAVSCGLIQIITLAWLQGPWCDFYKPNMLKTLMLIFPIHLVNFWGGWSTCGNHQLDATTSHPLWFSGFAQFARYSLDWYEVTHVVLPFTWPSN